MTLIFLESFGRILNMLKIRFQRVGRKNQPHFRVIVADSKIGPKSGKFLELLGSYNPKTKELNFKADRVKYWITNGAQVSGTVHNFLLKEKIIEGSPINVLPKKSSTKKKKAKAEEPKKTEEPKVVKEQ